MQLNERRRKWEVSGMAQPESVMRWKRHHEQQMAHLIDRTKNSIYLDNSVKMEIAKKPIKVKHTKPAGISWRSI